MCDYEAKQRYAQIQSVGVIKEIPLPLGNFHLATGGSLAAGISTSAPVGLSVFHADAKFRTLSFHASADETSFAYCTIPVPMDFRNQEANLGRKPSMELWLRARKVIVTGTPTDNDDLALAISSFIQSPTLDPKTGVETAGGAVLGDAVGGGDVLPEMSAEATVGASRIFKVDLLGTLDDAERMAVTPGGTIGIRVGINEELGADLRLDLWDFRLLYVGHLNPPQWVDNDVQA